LRNIVISRDAEVGGKTYFSLKKSKLEFWEVITERKTWECRDLWVFTLSRQ
jgi:hypothetical protein